MALALAAPVMGILSFRKLGLITRFPERWHPTIKWAHRAVSGWHLCCAWALMRDRREEMGRACRGSQLQPHGMARGRAGMTG